MKIPATIVTGFLGAGKTSLIRHLLSHSRGRRLALIINEFGDLGADREILTGCGIPECDEEDVIELANGCICCTVADDFLPAMRKILSRPDRPDHIVIETSGLALPKPLVKAFAWPEVRNAVTVDGVLVLADAEAIGAGRFAHDPDAVAKQRAADPSLDHESPLEELFEEQLLCGDLIVLNKVDRVSADDLAAIEAEVRPHLRPGVRLLWTSQGKIDPALALGLGVGAEDDLDSRPSHHDNGEDHDHDEFDSFVLDLPDIADPAIVEQRLRLAIERFDILRIKGFLAVTGRPLRHVVQAVGQRIERYYDRPWRADEARKSSLVVIGQRQGTVGLDRAAIRRMMVEDADA
jgi:cobalamin biosynthesis protein CobW